MNINVNGINVSVKQYADGAWGASYTTEFAPDSDIHTQIATAIGAKNWQVACIGASTPWSMNTGGDATWVMDFDITPDAVRAAGERRLDDTGAAGTRNRQELDDTE